MSPHRPAPDLARPTDGLDRPLAGGPPSTSAVLAGGRPPVDLTEWCASAPADEARLRCVASLLWSMGGVAPGPALALGTDLASPPPPPGMPDEDVEVAVRELDGHPAEVLAGTVAPAHWTAFGVLTTGRARWVDEPAGPDTATPVQLVFVAERSGRAVSLLGVPGSDPVAPPADDTTGRVADACRRVLGAPTPPPRAGTEELFALQWVRAIQTDLRSGVLDRPGWTELARRHPLFQPVLAGGTPELVRWAVDRLDRAGTIFADHWTWARLRQAVIDGDWTDHGLPPHVAAWLDDGAFSRELVGELPTIEPIVHELAAVVAPGPVRRLRTTLAAWDLLDAG